MEDGRQIWPFDWTPPARVAQPQIDLERVAASFAQVADAMNDAMRQLGEQATLASAALQRAYVSMVEAGLVPEQPPTDPRARALHLRRHRNTGPALPPLGRRR